MELNLERPLLVFDIESTGLNIVSDGIVELSFVKVETDGTQKVKTWRIKPWNLEANRQIPMNPQASEVNGIKDEDLKDCPKFISLAPEIVSWLRGADLAGFNSTKFDLPMLAEEIERVKAYCEKRMADPSASAEQKAKAKKCFEDIDIDLHSARMVDVQTIYHYMEPRNLKAAYRFYCGGEDFENAHSAEADTLATLQVLKGQLDMYQQTDKWHDVTLKNDVEFLANLGGRPKGVDYAGRIILKDGVPTVSFGKHKDKSVKEVFETDRGYYDWIQKGDFPMDTKRQFRILHEQFAADLLKSHFGSK